MGAVESAPETATFSFDTTAKLGLTAAASPNADLRATQTVTYTYTVTNLGGVTVSDVSIYQGAFNGSGPIVAGTCLATSLAPGASTTCSATYVVAQADVNARGTITAAATATGATPDETPVASNKATASFTTDQTSELTVAPVATPSSDVKAGETVDYTYTVTNTGALPLTEIAVELGSFNGSGMISAPECETRSLAPGTWTICTASYVVTQADVDLGDAITSHVTATGSDMDHALVTSEPGSASFTTDQTASLSLVKTASPASGVEVGHEVTYTFVVTNTGSVTVSDIAIDERAFSGSGTISAITCDATELAPGASTICEATYEATQADIDAETAIHNTAVATGETPDAEPVTSAEASAMFNPAGAPSLDITAAVTPTTGVAAGASVDYTFTVTNDGPIALTSLAVAVQSFSGTGTEPTITCDATDLAPDESTSCTAAYEVTSDDVDADAPVTLSVMASADNSGTNVDSPVVTVAFAPEGAVLPVSLSLTGVASPASGVKADQSVTYTFTVTNDGQAPATGVSLVLGTFTGSGTVGAVSCADATLLPGASTNCAVTYTATQQDVDTGTPVSLTAVASANGPMGVVDSDPATASFTVDQTAKLGLTAAADPDHGLAAGDTVSYTYAVTNNGSVTLNNIGMYQGAFNGSGRIVDGACADASLAPGDSTTCSATYVVTEADVVTGTITSSVTAMADTPDATTIVSAKATA